ncbi:DNA methyltransferase [Rossellomorea vietnamensis]|uniref:DNA methyltransferase n=1 Tax=Rossellomorea vietnamensis TaxID=218284 RepID=UPI00077CBBF4|nr:DNA methyltransferase [Rossellomorea vietnamensis]
MSNNVEQTSLFNKINSDNEEVTCLGITFKNDNERRDYFRNELRKKLPELKKLEGFPIAEDEEIISLSNPPYYTACPNPWINDFISNWNMENKQRENKEYKREPYTADISEGKTDPVYNAHSYHTKVPHKAIMRYILHYTSPNDVILDGFSGTGMTGVASQMCGDRETIKKLGYLIDDNGNIFDENNNKFSELGSRNTVLNDLSPLATFLAYNYNTPLDTEQFELEAKGILGRVENKMGWMYETDHNGSKGRINYVVWSDIFNCPECSHEICFYSECVNQKDGKVKESFQCPGCSKELNKKSLERSIDFKYDASIDQSVGQTKRIPVLINYSFDNNTYEKEPDENDIKIINEIDKLESSDWYPTNPMMNKGEKWGDTWRAGYHTGVTNVHHFYTKRNLVILSAILSEIEKNEHRDALKLLFSSHLINMSLLNRYRPGVSFPYNPLSGTLYIGSQISEANIFDAYKNKINRIVKAFYMQDKKSIIGCSSLTSLELEENSIDYIFTDPPFGENIMYSELSFIWESWLRLQTNNKKEAIISKSQHKELSSYQKLMEECFKVYYRCLKPNRWITIEFSNSRASVWNAIQEAAQKAGFIIANVSVLDKKQGSFKAVTSTIAVKQDLVISAYKPSNEMVEQIKKHTDSENSVWNFIDNHLEQLPILISENSSGQLVLERTPRILFDRMVAYHVQNGFPVPISSGEFQAKVSEKYPFRDGMIFLEKQVALYDKKRALVNNLNQLSLFVSDENSAIEWLRQQLTNKPQSRQDIHPNYMKEIQHIAKHELLPELDSLLEQNFLIYEGKEEVPSQIHGYLSSNYKDLRGLQKTDSKLKEKAKNRWYVPDPNKQADLEKLREKSLLREFESYKAEIEGNKKKLKQFRTEAIRTGFKKAWSEKDYQTIVKIGDRLPEKVLQEDDKLLMYFDNAQIRLGV